MIDIQNDFCPGGALGVKEGDMVIEPLNRLSSIFESEGGRIIATQDWHPAGHASFAESHEKKKPGDQVDLGDVKGQILWPNHCVQGSKGADFHQALNLKPVSMIIRKGFRKNLDSYSAFFENDRRTTTGLAGFLKLISVDTLILGGLATDYCVLYSAMDAEALGYKVFVVRDIVRGVGYPEGSIERAFKQMGEAGVNIITSKDIE